MTQISEATGIVTDRAKPENLNILGELDYVNPSNYCPKGLEVEEAEGRGEALKNAIARYEPLLEWAENTLHRAKIYHLLYLDREFKERLENGKKAITCYLEYLKTIENDNFNIVEKDLLENALQIFFGLGLNSKKEDKNLTDEYDALDVLTRIENLIKEDYEKNLYNKLYLVSLLIKNSTHVKYDASKHLEYIEKAINHFESQICDNEKGFIFYTVQPAYEVAIALLERNKKNQEKKISYQKRYAELYVKAVEIILSSSDNQKYASALVCYQDARDYYFKRNIPASKKRQNELEKKICELQILHMENTKYAIYTQYIECAPLEVKGKDLNIVLDTFSKNISLFTIKQINKFLEISNASLILSVVRNDKGMSKSKTNSPKKNVKNEDENPQEYINFFSSPIIAPELAEIVGVIHCTLDEARKEHPKTAEEFWFKFLENKAFIPEGRKDLVARALYSGFKGDFVSFAHLIIPQLENSFREILGKNSENPVKFKDDSSQEFKASNWALDINYDKLSKIIPEEDIIFHFRCLLIGEPEGFRHQVSHGLLSMQKIEPSAKYLYLLVIKILSYYKEPREIPIFASL